MLNIEGIKMDDIIFEDQNRAVITNDKINKNLNEVLDFLGTQEIKIKIKKVKVEVDDIEFGL